MPFKKRKKTSLEEKIKIKERKNQLTNKVEKECEQDESWRDFG